MYQIKLWKASLIGSDLSLTFEDASGKITEIIFSGVSESILSFISDDNNRRRIRKTLEESYKYEILDQFKIIY